MDNLSHSVVGLAVGELVHRSLPQEGDIADQSLRRRLLLIACWAASNFPDLDLVLTPLLPAPLGYLLHHRGHTHTLLYAIPQAILLWSMIWALSPPVRTLLRKSASARTGLIATLSLGFALHMMMDYLNSYGIHPFHPFDSRWLYGDMVFIIEPTFWILLGVPMAMMVRHTALKLPLLAVLVGAPLHFTLRGFLSFGSFAALVLAAVAMGTLQQRAGASSRRALVVALCLSIGFIGMQGFASGQARLAVAELLQKKDPESRLLDASMTSFPTNPLCWTFVTIESNERAGAYRLRRGVLSVAPGIVPAAECPDSVSERPSPDGGTPAIAFLLEEQGSLDALRRLKDENCHFEAWLRFARAPSLSDTKASDIRFGPDPRENFTTMNFADFSNQECSRFIPRWGFPRSDLLSPQAPADAR